MLISNLIFIYRSLPYDAPMALYLHGGEGKEATKKEKKTYVEGLQATNNVIKMEIDGSGPYFRKNKMS